MGPLGRIRGSSQALIAVCAVAAVFAVRVMLLRGASPYELFLLLDILIAILLGPIATGIAAGLGLVGANLVIAIEGSALAPGRYWVMTGAYFVFAGLLVGFNLLGHRVSSRARRERRLKQELAASSPDGVVSLDGAGRLLDFNRAAAVMLGRFAKDVAGQPFADTFLAAPFRERISRMVAGQLPEAASLQGERVEMRALRASGEEFPVEVALVRVGFEQEVYFICHLRDITDRKAHEAERERLLAHAERANRIKDHILANVSHELRTPLNAIMGWAAMLRRGQVAPGNLKHAAEVIERNARAQARVVDDLLDAALAAAGRLRIDAQPVDVEAVVHDVVGSMRPSAQAQGIVLTDRLAAGLGTVEGDPARIRQVLLTLIANAIKFTPPGGEIALDAERAEGAVTIRVTDTGAGIAAEFLPAVFERFSQGDASPTRSHGGIGLGLSIARHLVELMGGAIEAESEGAGHGAVFSIRLPAGAPVRDSA